MNEELNTETSQESQKSSGMNTMMVIGAVVVLAVIGFFVIRSTAKQPTQEASSTDTTEEAGMEDMENHDAMMTAEQGSPGSTMNDTPMEITMDGDVMVVNMEAGAFYYSPNTITVKKGQKVRIVMSSVGDNEMMMHDFVIDDLDVSMDRVPVGETGTVEFVADTVGEFEYYCSVSDHRDKGQVGTLIVEE